MNLISKILTLGEGKTLVAVLAGYLNAIPGRGVHVVFSPPHQPTAFTS